MLTAGYSLPRNCFKYRSKQNSSFPTDKVKGISPLAKIGIAWRENKDALYEGAETEQKWKTSGTDIVL